MTGWPQWSFDGIDQVLYDSIVAQVKAAGAKVNQPTDAPTGTFEYEGCEFVWSYDSAAQIVYLTCTKPSFLAKNVVGENGVYQRISALIDKAKGATA